MRILMFFHQGLYRGLFLNHLVLQNKTKLRNYEKIANSKSSVFYIIKDNFRRFKYVQYFNPILETKAKTVYRGIDSKRPLSKALSLQLQNERKSG